LKTVLLRPIARAYSDAFSYFHEALPFYDMALETIEGMTDVDRAQCLHIRDMIVADRTRCQGQPGA
jgi:hypothetical protein